MDFRKAYDILQQRFGEPSDCCCAGIEKADDTTGSTCESQKTAGVNASGSPDLVGESPESCGASSCDDIVMGHSHVTGSGDGDSTSATKNLVNAATRTETAAATGSGSQNVERLNTNPDNSECGGDLEVALRPEIYEKIIESLDLIERDGQMFIEGGEGRVLETLKSQPSSRVVQLQGRRARVRFVGFAW